MLSAVRGAGYTMINETDRIPVLEFIIYQQRFTKYSPGPNSS